jgi:iron(III) transport system substrate-binding protein
MNARIPRRLAMAGLGLLAAPPQLPRIANAADLGALEEAARKEGTLTWYVAQMSSQVAEAMGRRFTARYPGIKVTVIRTTGQVAYERLMQEIKNKTPQCDVFSSTDIAHYPALKARGALARYDPANAAALAPPFHGLGEAGFYYPVIASLQGIIYRNDKVLGADVPRRLTDLLDPKWKGQIATGHPAFSGYFGQFVVAVTKLYGWSFFEKLAKNNPRIGRSAGDPITLLNASECMIGLSAASVTLQTAEQGNPIGFVYPEDGTLLTIGPSAVLAEAPHPNAGRLFLEWLLGTEFAEASAREHMVPVRADAPAMLGGKPLSEIKLLTLTTAEIAKGIPEVVEQWRDTFGN